MRLQKSLDETGGSFVKCRLPFGKSLTSSAEQNEILLNYLMNPEFPGYFCINTVNRNHEAGMWEYEIGISDPDVAFEFKMKFG
jgi:hypothetical protein